MLVYIQNDLLEQRFIEKHLEPLSGKTAPPVTGLTSKMELATAVFTEICVY